MYAVFLGLAAKSIDLEVFVQKTIDFLILHSTYKHLPLASSSLRTHTAHHLAGYNLPLTETISNLDLQRHYRSGKDVDLMKLHHE